MILRIAVFALMALGFTGFAGIAWLATRPQTVAVQPEVVTLAAIPAPPITLSKVLATARPLRAGMSMKADDLTGIDPAGLPEGTLADTPAARLSLVGAMVKHSLAAGAPILPADVVRPGDHGFLAAVLGPGLRGITVAVDVVSGSAGLIWPGDRIDLILTQELDAQNVPMGRRVLGETVLPNLRVVAIDQQMVQGVSSSSTDAVLPKTVTLEVTPKQVETVAVASRIGRLSVIVRSADAPLQPEPAPPARPVVTWASDVSPALASGPAQPTSTLRVYQGSADGKEFKF